MSGTRMARVQIYVNGRLKRDITPAILQKRVVPRVMLARRVKRAGGVYRLRVRVSFQLGSGKRPLNLKRIVRVCRVLAARHPHFTG
jgi:hypothetical protein